jgi:hypothetical protein
MMRFAVSVLVLTVAACVSGCRPSDVLSVPAPAGVLASSGLESQTGAEGAFSGAKVQLFTAIDAGLGQGLLQWSELLTDELTAVVSPEPSVVNIDARITSGSVNYVESGDQPWANLLQARSSLVLALPLLAKYEPASGRSKIGEAYALMGYAELFVAESYCSGTPLDQVISGGGIQYSMPLTTDSLLKVAMSDFDSATARGSGSDTVAGLASVGMGRALLDLGQFAAAASAVHAVPTSYIYNVEMEPNVSGSSQAGPNLYQFAAAFRFARVFNVSDREGGNGLDFVSAHDARLQFDTSMTTNDGTTWYFPLKFEVDPAHTLLASGIEARLIEAEATLKAGQTSVWLGDLNALRNGGCTVSASDTTCSLGTGQVPGQTVGLPSLGDPGTDSGRVSLMFRERAFWLFGTGTRLGDMRRLIRQYGRDRSTVFPTGPYANGQNPRLPAPIPNYGTDVALTLPTPQSGTAISNPHYRGCITSTATP